MSRLTTKRATKIDNDFTAIEKSLASVSSNLVRDTNLIIQLTAWLHDNIINNRGDFDENDRADLFIKFEPVFLEISEQLSKLGECAAVYHDDLFTYEQNLNNFVAKYPSANPVEVDKRYS